KKKTAPAVGMKIRILDSALADLEKGRGIYEEQGEGLGSYFLDSLFSDIDSLAVFGGVHAVRFGYHRLLAKRFPYAVYYKMSEGAVVHVWRVLDCRQHPRKIKQALK